MSKQKTNKPIESKPIYEGNLYDKIFQENAESIFIPLVEERLGIKIKTFKHLREKIQVTIEREMDFFYEIETIDSKNFILHLEFQTEDDPEMLYRNGEYHSIKMRLHKKKIRHVVVFLGKSISKMRTQLEDDEIYRGFELINIYQLDSQKLLSSQIPDVIVTAILANFPEDQTEQFLRLIVRNLKAACQNPSELSKYIKQLVMLARLRKIEDLTLKIAEEMPITYNIETDYLYQQGIATGEQKGIEKGLEKGQILEKQKTIERLLVLYNWSIQQVADFAEVSESFVISIKNQLIKDGKLKG